MPIAVLSSCFRERGGVIQQLRAPRIVLALDAILSAFLQHVLRQHADVAQEGNPGGNDRPRLWQDLAAVMDRKYPDAYGGEWPVDLYGVDSGYNTNTVYEFCRRQHRARATKGDDGWHRPAIPATRSPT